MTNIGFGWLPQSTSWKTKKCLIWGSGCEIDEFTKNRDIVVLASAEALNPSNLCNYNLTKWSCFCTIVIDNNTKSIPFDFDYI